MKLRTQTIVSRTKLKLAKSSLRAIGQVTPEQNCTRTPQQLQHNDFAKKGVSKSTQWAGMQGMIENRQPMRSSVPFAWSFSILEEYVKSADPRAAENPKPKLRPKVK
eukprot:4366216-Amphidinium_carterae.1